MLIININYNYKLFHFFKILIANFWILLKFTQRRLMIINEDQFEDDNEDKVEDDHQRIVEVIIKHRTQLTHTCKTLLYR